MSDRNDGAWFVAKRCGYGAGLPIAWHEWVLLGGYVALEVLVATVMKEHRALRVTLMLSATLCLIVVAARKTRGGWRWRG